jgi:hypothetical protein
MKDSVIHIVFGGRGRGKMMALEEFLKLLPEDKRKDVVIVKASDPVPELRGNKLPRIVDYDIMETTEFTWELYERLKAELNERQD